MRILISASKNHLSACWKWFINSHTKQKMWPHLSFHPIRSYRMGMEYIWEFATTHKALKTPGLSGQTQHLPAKISLQLQYITLLLRLETYKKELSGQIPVQLGIANRLIVGYPPTALRLSLAKASVPLGICITEKKVLNFPIENKSIFRHKSGVIQYLTYTTT